MGSILENYDPWARLWLQALLNSLWQGALIVALVLLLFRVIGRASATTRHAVWFIGLLAIAVLPFLPASRGALPAASSASSGGEEQTASSPQESGTAAAEGNSLPVLGKSIRQPKGAIIIGPEALAPREEAAAAGMAVTASALARGPGESALDRWNAKVFAGRAPLVLIALWCAACALMLWRVAWSYLFLFRLRRSLSPLPPLQQRQMERLAYIFGLKRRIRLCTSSAVSMPMTIGWVSPLVVLPQGLTSSLSESEYESIVAHELAHIKRWDYVTNLLQRLIQAYLFFHPAVWVIGKQLAVERELACDDWAVRLIGEPRRYASCLTKLAELLSEGKPLAVATGMIFGKHVVSRRVEMILNSNRNATTFVSKPAVLYAVGLAVLSLSICSSLSPVIAVPLVQGRAAAASQEANVSTPAPAKAPKAAIAAADPSAATQSGAPTAATAPKPASSASAAPSSGMEPRPAPLPALSDELAPAALAALPPEPADEAELEVVEPRPAPMPVAYLASQAVAGSPALFFNGPAPVAQQPIATTPRVPIARGRAISVESSDTPPAISESELLGVLTDIVKRDADPTVRGEALQGIIRFRSDASVNTLLQLYDSLTDAKVKTEIINNLLRRKGDNAKATAKLVSIAKTEKDEELRKQALRQLLNLKGDEGAGSLIEVYDSLQDSKAKQTVIRYLAYNKSRKAIDKLIQIAKSDSDPMIRQVAIRSLSGIDSRIYLELMEKAHPNVSLNGDAYRELTASMEGQLHWRLAELEGQLDQLHKTYTDKHPKVIETESLLKALEKELEAIQRQNSRD